MLVPIHIFAFLSQLSMVLADLSLNFILQRSAPVPTNGKVMNKKHCIESICIFCLSVCLSLPLLLSLSLFLSFSLSFLVSLCLSRYAWMFVSTYKVGHLNMCLCAWMYHSFLYTHVHGLLFVCKKCACSSFLANKLTTVKSNTFTQESTETPVWSALQLHKNKTTTKPISPLVFTGRDTRKSWRIRY